MNIKDSSNCHEKAVNWHRIKIFLTPYVEKKTSHCTHFQTPWSVRRSALMSKLLGTNVEVQSGLFTVDAIQQEQIYET